MAEQNYKQTKTWSEYFAPRMCANRYAPPPSELEFRAKELSYPANQEYEINTLQPLGVAEKRVEHVRRNVPELDRGGVSLLDVGFNKGFVCLHYADRFQRIVGYEPSTPYCELAEGVRRAHKIENVEFINAAFHQIQFDKEHAETFDVVYAGSVHHHFFKDAILRGAPPHIALRKLAAMCKKFLIIDGPFSFGDDCSLNTWAKEYGWGEEVKSLYTLEKHVAEIEPHFKLSYIVENERRRQTAVFERVLPDVRRVSEKEIRGQIEAGGIELRCNAARPKGSMYRIGDRRVKFDPGHQIEGVYMILNGLPDRFAKTLALIENEHGEIMGDVAEWIYGRNLSLENGGELWRPWLEMNNDLSTVGLMEHHFKPSDCVIRDGKYIDIDLDMIRFPPAVALNEKYMNNWLNVKKKILKQDKHAALEHLHNNLMDDLIFYKTMNGEK